MSTVSVHWAWLFCLFICFACVLLCFHPEMSKCWKTIGFIVFSLTNVEKAFVLLCFWGLGSRKHWIYIHFIGILFNKLRFLWESLCENAKKAKKWKKHLFFQRKIFRMYKTISKFWFWWKSPNETKTAKAKFSGWLGNRFTLCVCFCVVPSLNQNENP